MSFMIQLREYQDSQIKTTPTPSLPSINNIINNFSKEDIQEFIKDLASAFKDKYSTTTLTTITELSTAATPQERLINKINPSTGALYTYKEKQMMKPSIFDPHYVKNIKSCNSLGIDLDSREGTEMILAKEDAEIMTKARMAEKKRVYGLLAKEEFKRGLIPVSFRQIDNIQNILDMKKIEELQLADKTDKRYGIRCIIKTNKPFENKILNKLVKKQWIKDEYILTKSPLGYDLQIRYMYKKKDGNMDNRPMSMMKKELCSTLGIERSDIQAVVITKTDWFKTNVTIDVD